MRHVRGPGDIALQTCAGSNALPGMLRAGVDPDSLTVLLRGLEAVVLAGTG